MKKLIITCAMGLSALSGMAKASDNCQYCDLRYKDFTQRKQDAANYSGAYLYGTNFSLAVLPKANFESAVLTFARLEWADLDGANFSKATLEDAALSRSSLRHADFRMANLARANLSKTYLNEANFLTASLQNAKLMDARLFGANFRNANLSGADLSGAHLRNADLQGAVLKGADLQGSDMDGANFSGANMDGTTFGSVAINLANFRSASLKKANFTNAVMSAVNFQDADLTGADFTGASLQNVLLQGAKLCDAHLPDGTVYVCDGKTSEDVAHAALLKGVGRENIARIALSGNVFAYFSRGRVTGVFAEVVEGLIGNFDLDPVFVSLPKDMALKALDEGRLHAATVVHKNVQIADKYLFSDPVVSEYQILLVKKGKSFALTKRADLQGKIIGARKGYFYDLLDKQDGMQSRRYTSDGEMIRALLQDEVDAIILAGIADIYSLRAEGIMHKFDVIKTTVGVIPLSVAFSKSRYTQQFVNDFNKNLSECKAGSNWLNIVNNNGMADLIEPYPVMAP